MMQTQEIARARSHSYTLFGQLFLDGVTADLLPYVQAILPLASELPKPFDADDAAAAHYALFRQSVLPYATVFVDAAGLLGGQASSAVRLAFEQAGYEAAAAHSPDHLGEMLLFLGFLSAQEAESNEEQRRLFWQAKQQDFLQAHLLPWLPALHVALQQENAPFFMQLSELTLALIVDQREGMEAVQQEMLPMATVPALNLADERTGLKQIAAFLTNPPQSGLYLSRVRLEQLARGVSLPRGFGKRADLLNNLLRSAAQYGEMGAVVEEITAVFYQWQQAYEQLITEQPMLKLHLHSWQTLLRETQRLLIQMKEQTSLN